MYPLVYNHFNANSIICHAQHDFIKNQSCETQHAIIVNEIASSFNLSEHVDVISLDFTKAFDKMLLLCKLDFYGIATGYVL